MLLGFRVENHRSLRDAQEFDLRPIYNKTADAVPVAALYGANASGKSNLIDALMFMHDGVINQNRRWTRDSGIPRRPFVLSRVHRAAPSKYAVDLFLDGTHYTYGFSIDDSRVLGEWLYRYAGKSKRKDIIFERDGQSFAWGAGISETFGEVIKELTPQNMLILALIPGGNFPEIRKVADWFRHSFWYADDRNESMRMSFTHRLLESPDGVDRLVKLLQSADLGIHGVQLNITELTGTEGEHENTIVFQPTNGPKIKVQITGDHVGDATSRVLAMGLESMLFTHAGDDPADIPLADESRGTRTWLALLGFTLSALSNGWTLAIDELDTSLHPVLITQLIRIFQNPETNPRGAQLIFTTHDASLLGRQGGSEILRRDEIWFVEKEHQTGASSMFPLTDFRPRDGLNWERRYLGGSLGAVPFIDEEALALAIRPEPPEEVDG